MTIAILGYSGFLGSFLIKDVRLASSKKILPSRSASSYLQSGEDLIIPFKDAFRAIREMKPEVIVNLIGVLREKERGEYRQAHVQTTLSLAEAASSYSGARIVQISALGGSADCRSEYFRTKREAEDILLKSGIETVILRPGIIFGEGQKFFSDLKKIASFLPFILCPDSSLAVSAINETVDAVIKAANGEIRPGIYEVYSEIISYKDFSQRSLSFLRISRKVFTVPPFFLLPAAIAGELTEMSPLNIEQYRMLSCTALPSGKYPRI
ncbi:MAG: hypothetical protein Fur0012_01600 [Elusimicrobiota bacterium]